MCDYIKLRAFEPADKVTQTEAEAEKVLKGLIGVLRDDSYTSAFSLQPKQLIGVNP